MMVVTPTFSFGAASLHSVLYSLGFVLFISEFQTVMISDRKMGCPQSTVLPEASLHLCRRQSVRSILAVILLSEAS